MGKKTLIPIGPYHPLQEEPEFLPEKCMAYPRGLGLDNPEWNPRSKCRIAELVLYQPVWPDLQTDRGILFSPDRFYRIAVLMDEDPEPENQLVPVAEKCLELLFCFPLIKHSQLGCAYCDL